MTTVRELIIKLLEFPLTTPVVIDVDDGIAKAYHDIVHVRTTMSATGLQLVVLDSDYEEPKKQFKVNQGLVDKEQV